MTEQEREEKMVEDFMFAMHDMLKIKPEPRCEICGEPSPEEDPCVHCPECELPMYDGECSWHCV